MDTSGAGSWGLRGPTGGGLAPVTPSGTSQRDTPPAQGGIEILGTATLADVVCGAVGLPLAHAAQVPAVQGVSVHRLIAGSSCY